jgi:hypothetical protein
VGEGEHFLAFRARSGSGGRAAGRQRRSSTYPQAELFVPRTGRNSSTWDSVHSLCSRAGPACSACGRLVRPDENIFETSHLFGDSTLMGLRSGDPRRPLHIGKRGLRATGKPGSPNCDAFWAVKPRLDGDPIFTAEASTRRAQMGPKARNYLTEAT